MFQATNAYDDESPELELSQGSWPPLRALDSQAYLIMHSLLLRNIAEMRCSMGGWLPNILVIQVSLSYTLFIVCIGSVQEELKQILYNFFYLSPNPLFLYVLGASWAINAHSCHSLQECFQSKKTLKFLFVWNTKTLKQQRSHSILVYGYHTVYQSMASFLMWFCYSGGCRYGLICIVWGL